MRRTHRERKRKNFKNNSHNRCNRYNQLPLTKMDWSNRLEIASIHSFDFLDPHTERISCQIRSNSYLALIQPTRIAMQVVMEWYQKMSFRLFFWGKKKGIKQF